MWFPTATCINLILPCWCLLLLDQNYSSPIHPRTRELQRSRSAPSTSSHGQRSRKSADQVRECKSARIYLYLLVSRAQCLYRNILWLNPIVNGHLRILVLKIILSLSDSLSFCLSSSLSLSFSPSLSHTYTNTSLPSSLSCSFLLIFYYLSSYFYWKGHNQHIDDEGTYITHAIPWRRKNMNMPLHLSSSFCSSYSSSFI